MVRIKGGLATHKRKRKLFRFTKGYKFAKKNRYRAAKEQANRSLVYAYRDRKNKKRVFRSLWITRINAGTQANGLTYHELIHGLRKANISINRQMLAELAIRDTGTFSYLVTQAKQSLTAG